jgi:hypothetical protein
MVPGDAPFRLPAHQDHHGGDLVLIMCSILASIAVIFEMPCRFWPFV